MKFLKHLQHLAVAALMALSASMAPVAPLVAPVATVAASVAVVAPLTALMASEEAQATVLTDYAENKLVDWLFRGQSFTPPATIYWSLMTTTCTDSSGGTEVSTSSTGYGRVAVTGSLANWAGTQSSGSTTASSGTGGTTSNNGSITFGTPIANWGTVVATGGHDASTAGNLVICIPLTVNKTINNGDAAPVFPAAALSVQIDN